MFRPSAIRDQLSVWKDGVEYKPHPHGWGHVAVGAQVDLSVYVDISSRVGPGVVIEGLVSLEQNAEITGISHISGRNVRIVDTKLHNVNLRKDGLVIKRGRKILPLD